MVYIRKYLDSWGVKRVEINLLGLSIRFPYGNWKAYRQKRKQRRREKRKKRAEKKFESFRAENQKYISCKKDRTIRRLFITSGNIHLLNALALISQLSEEDTDPVENHVIVWSVVTNDDFEKTSRKIANLFGIQHYYAICGTNCDKDYIIKYIEKLKLTNIDEVYGLRLATLMIVYETLYRNARYFILDEGVYSLVPDPKRIAHYCKKIITTFFLNKLDYVEFPGRPWIVEHIQSKHFNSIARKCASLYPLEIHHYDPQNKYVVFCGNYTAHFYPYTEEEMESRQNQIIQALNDRGYHILYKPHPRDPVKRENRKGLTILRTRLPLECYSLRGFYAVVSLCSSACTQSYHYSKIPGFVDPEFCYITHPPHLAALVNEYTPPIDLLLEINVQDKAPEELRREIERCYESYIADKPLLSQNELFNSTYHALLKRR